MPDSVHPDERERIAAEAVADMIAGSSIDDDALTLGHQIVGKVLSILRPAPVAEGERERTFGDELTSLINRYSKESGSNTPDFVLARYLINCLEAFDTATQWRAALRAPTKREPAVAVCRCGNVLTAEDDGICDCGRIVVWDSPSQYRDSRGPEGNPAAKPQQAEAEGSEG